MHLKAASCLRMYGLLLPLDIKGLSTKKLENNFGAYAWQ